MSVSDRDCRSVRDVVMVGRRDETTDGMPWALLEGLMALIPCDKVSFPESDLLLGRSIVHQELSGRERVLEVGSTEGHPEFARCVREFRAWRSPARTGDLISVVTWSVFYTRLEVHNTPLFVDYFNEGGQRNGMHIAFPCAPGHMRKISFWR